MRLNLLDSELAKAVRANIDNWKSTSTEGDHARMIREFLTRVLGLDVMHVVIVSRSSESLFVYEHRDDVLLLQDAYLPDLNQLAPIMERLGMTLVPRENKWVASVRGWKQLNGHLYAERAEPREAVVALLLQLEGEER